MARNVVFPFKIVRPDSEAVKAGRWFARSGDAAESWLDHGAGLDDWSYDTNLKVGREVEIDGPLLAEELGIAHAAPVFELVHSIRVSSLALRNVLHQQQFSGSESLSEVLTHQLDSKNLCEEITLCAAVTLAVDLNDVPAWAMSARGSICWQDETRVFIEGFGSRFPMQDTPFSEHPRLPSSANWHLDWRPALLHYSFNSAVRLLLNSEKQEFLQRMQGKDDILTGEVMGSIMAQICGYTLGDEDIFGDEADFPEGSLGSIAQSWLLNALPGRSISEIRAEFGRTPSTVHTALRSLAATTLR